VVSKSSASKGLGLTDEEIRFREIAECTGQIVPREDVLRIEPEWRRDDLLGICPCRLTYAGEYVAACIGLGIVPEIAREMGFRLPKDPMLRDKAKRSGIRIPLTVGEVKDELMDEWEDNGWVHIVFTFGAPYIGGICNCEAPVCLALQKVKAQQYPTMGPGGVLKSEYIAVVDPDECTGCKKCILMCQFGAIRVVQLTGRAVVDPVKCTGCGLCRHACEQSAIKLVERSKIPIAVQEWRI